MQENTSNIISGQDLTSYKYRKEIEERIAFIIEETYGDNKKCKFEIRISSQVKIVNLQYTFLDNENTLKLFIPETESYSLKELCKELHEFLIKEPPLGESDDSFHDDINGHKNFNHKE